jgi:hypothetical protein
MAYCTAAQIRAYLNQVPSSEDTLLDTIAERATGIVDQALGKNIRFTGYTTGSRTVYLAEDPRRPVAHYEYRHPYYCERAERSVWLRLPPYDQGTITSIIDAESKAITDYSEAWHYGDFYIWREDCWTSTRYTITADFGYGDPPPEIVEVTIGVATNIWRSKDRGLFSDVIGVETGPGGGAVVGYQGALTNQQRMVIKGVQRRYREVFV